MNSPTGMIREFHERMNFDRDLSLDQRPDPRCEADAGCDATQQLLMAAYVLADLAKRWERGDPLSVAGVQSDSYDPRLMRAHLLCEELAETLQALAMYSERDLLDGLCDLLYVTYGLAVTYGLPADEGLAEVHRSNMTKVKRDQGDHRCRDKGAQYVPPDLDRVLDEHRGKFAV